MPDEQSDYTVEQTIWVRVYAYDEEDAKKIAAGSPNGWQDWDVMTF